MASKPKLSVVPTAPASDAVTDAVANSVTYAVRQIPIKRIRAFASQPRKWFDPDETRARAESMRLLGQQDPVTVEPVTGDKDHDYELINGESRLRSAQEAGLKTLWAAVRSVPFGSVTDKHLASLVANFNRADHTPMEISDALQLQSTDGGLTQAELAKALGKSQTWVFLYLSLQKLHPDIQAMMHPSRPAGERMAASTAFELARLPMAKQAELIQSARDVDGKVTVKRMQLRALKSGGQRPAVIGPTSMEWTPERDRRRQAMLSWKPDQVAHLRAGIEEFRRLLDSRR